MPMNDGIDLNGQDAWMLVFCPHGCVYPWADHPAAGTETCEHGCTDRLLVDPVERAEQEDEAQKDFGF